MERKILFLVTFEHGHGNIFGHTTTFGVAPEQLNEIMEYAKSKDYEIHVGTGVEIPSTVVTLKSYEEMKERGYKQFFKN